MTDITNPLHITSVSFEKVSSSRNYVLVMGDGYLIHFRAFETEQNTTQRATERDRHSSGSGSSQYSALLGYGNLGESVDQRITPVPSFCRSCLKSLESKRAIQHAT